MVEVVVRPRASGRPRRTTRTRPRRAPARRAGSARRARRWSGRSGAAARRRRRCRAPRRGSPATPGGRVDLGGGDLEQRGLAGAVGAEDHPALVLLDRQSTSSSRVASPRRTVTSANSRTAVMAVTLSRLRGRPAVRRSVTRRDHALPACRPAGLVGDRLAARPRGRRPAPRRRRRRRRGPRRGRPDDGRPSRWSPASARLRAPGATGVGAGAPRRGDPVGLGGPRDVQRRGARGRARRWCSTGAGLGLVPDRVGAGGGVAADARPSAASCPTSARPTASCGPRCWRPPTTAGRARRRPLAARGGRRADEPAAPAAVRAPPGVPAALRRPGRARAAGARRSSTWRSRTTAAR